VAGRHGRCRGRVRRGGVDSREEWRRERTGRWWKNGERLLYVEGEAEYGGGRGPVERTKGRGVLVFCGKKTRAG